MRPTEPGHTLLPIARTSIALALGQITQEANVTLDAPWLHQPGACFVTLSQRGRLRGCIGSLEAHRSLLADVQANALAAALSDPRFAPLTAAELEHTDIEVSLLSAMQALSFASEAEAMALLRPGIDGVVLAFGRHRSTFLPQVWEQLPRAGDFLAQLKTKAGLPPGFWADGIRLERYTVSKWREVGRQRQAAAADERLEV